MKLVIYETKHGWAWEVRDISAFVIWRVRCLPDYKGFAWTERRAIKKGCRALANWQKAKARICENARREQETIREINCDNEG